MTGAKTHCQSWNLNTSHVILYPFLPQAAGYGYQDLNTSHVILYQKRQKEHGTDKVFKYISCYSLSGGGDRIGGRYDI